VTVTTGDGQEYDVVYCRWLDHKLTGAERLKLPLPTIFPLHQWAETYMGMGPEGSRAWYATDSFGVIDASKVLNLEPIVSIGVRDWRPLASYRGEAIETQRRRRREDELDGARGPERVGVNGRGRPKGVGKTLVC
jgi:hypothetical protein